MRDVSVLLAGGGAMGELVRRHPWERTPLGPLSDWPQALRTAVSLMLDIKGLGAVLWGPELRLIYNDAYAGTLAHRHPDALGRPMMAVWGETTAPLLQKFQHVLDTGEPYGETLQQLPMLRDGAWITTWWNAVCSPVRDEHGRVIALFNLAMETTGQVEAGRLRAEAEAEREALIRTLAEREAFLSGVLSASTDCIKVLDRDGRLSFMSEGGQRVMEVSDFNRIAGCPWPDFWAGAGNAEANAAIEAARRGEARSFVGEAGTMAGTPKWWHVAVSPIGTGRDGNGGGPDRILAVSRDITEIKTSEAERDRFVRLVENSADFVGMAHRDGRMFFLNQAGRRLVGLEQREVAGLGIADFLPPDEAGRVEQTVLPAVDRDGHWAGEVGFRHLRTGEPIPMLVSVFAMADDTGAATGYGTVARDFRTRKAAEAQLQLLNGELSHRLKNTLGVVQAIAAQTLGTTDPEAVAAFGGRLVTLSAAHDVLLRDNWSAAMLGEVAGEVLRTFDAGHRLRIEGPELSIGPRATLSLSLLLHELGTNATKHGALGVPTGTVLLRWQVHGEGEQARLSMRWEERGGPPAVAPTRRGFGSRIIRMGLTGSGGTTPRYTEAGLIVDMTATLAQLQAV